MFVRDCMKQGKCTLPSVFCCNCLECGKAICSGWRGFNLSVCGV
jgi:hypothetical protein